MSREIDRRDHTINKLTPAREQDFKSAAAAVSDRLPGAHRVSIAGFDAQTGNPSSVRSEAAPAEPGDHVQRALDHVRRISRALGLTSSQATDYVADPEYQKTSTGAVAVHLQQCYKGIPIFQASEAVRFEPNGAIKETVGSSVTIQDEIGVAPKLTVEQAVEAAAKHVAEPQDDELKEKDAFGEPMNPPAVDVKGFAPRVIAAFAEKPDRPTVLEAGPFGDEIKARLLWFPLADKLRLTWEVILTMPGHAGQFRTLVDIENGEVLYCRQLVRTVAAKGNVYRLNGGSPRVMTDFPRLSSDYGLPVPGGLPGAFPDTWVSADRTIGNCVNAHLGETGPSTQGTVQTGALSFNPTDATGDDQKVLNIFYYNCVMHDFFYLLGFRESDGNFQSNNFGRGGLALDPVDARAHPGPVFGTANMGTPIDGLNPVMNMGLVSSTGRHTALDSSVVFHEFTHGVSNRLVGGPANDRALEAPQSVGMGEGWSDYIACTINNTTVVGDWVVNRIGGLRRFPYDSSYPQNFGNLGPTFDDEHDIGEIWCATLMEMNRNIGSTLGVQLVVDALKLTPANPSFLDARDAILAALDAALNSRTLTPAQFQTARTGIWAAFAKFGMGPGARSNGATLTGIVADFTVPASPTPPSTPAPGIKVEATPNSPIQDFTNVTSTLQILQAGRIKRLTVSVNIQHTFIGDLRVTLSAPSGRAVALHSRSGGDQKNLVTSYKSEDVADLASLLGTQAQGTWTLNVADEARKDEGTLRQWGLEIDLEGGNEQARGEASPGSPIPDNDATGVTSSISITQPGTLQGIKVAVDITHTWIGDLEVELISPSGQRVLLHDRAGGSADNLIQTYDSVSSPALAPLLGRRAEGTWQLQVKDRDAADTGKLNRWSLELSLTSTPPTATPAAAKHPTQAKR